MDIKVEIAEVFIDCSKSYVKIEEETSKHDVLVFSDDTAEDAIEHKLPLRLRKDKQIQTKKLQCKTVKAEGKHIKKSEEPNGKRPARKGRPSDPNEDPELKPFPCNVCQKRFKKKYEVGLHMATHITSRDFKCEHCSNAYPTKARLSSHMAVHKGRGFHCDICNRKFAGSQSLKTHIQRHASNNPRKIVKTAEQMATIKAGGKIYKCPICGKGIKSRYRIKEHMVVHTTQKNFHCPDCNMSFADKRRLTNHSHIHKGDYKCNYCGKIYSAMHSLKKHMEKHIDEDKERKENETEEIEPIEFIHGQCKKCGKTFKRLWKLNYHMMGVHGIHFNK